MHSRRRSLPSYLLLPRPGDLVKMIIFPVAFAVGCVTRGPAGADALLDAGIVWLALELLVYQARYQWNDIRGFEADQRHADGDRGRLPGPIERRRSRVRWSAAVAVAKVLAAIAAGLLVGSHGVLLMVGLAVGVFVLAAAYEALREVSTGHSDRVPARATKGVLGIWIAIGSGYALRAVAGLGMAVDLDRPRLLLPVAVATCWLFGVAWITSRWAVEATAHARCDDTGRLHWESRREQAREHQLALVRWLPREAPAGVTDLSRWEAVRGRAPLTAPWFVTGVVTCGLAAVGGALLTDPSAGPGALVLTAAAGLAAGLVVGLAGRRRSAAVVAGALLMVAAAMAVQVAQPLASAVPWLVIAVSQERYLRQDRASLGRLGRGLRPLGRRRDAADAGSHVTPEGVSWTSSS